MFKSRYHFPSLIFAAGLFGLLGAASAETIIQPVTPAFVVNDNPKRFSVVVEKRTDGLIHFTITYYVSHPMYLVANSEIRDGDKVLFQNTSAAFVREDSASYYLTVAPERLADAKFEWDVSGFAESDGHPTPEPGGTDFQIQLSEFAKSATETK